MVQMWQVVVAVFVCMATMGYGVPLGDTATFKEPAKDSLMIPEQQDTKVTKAEDDSSSHYNPLQAEETSNIQKSLHNPNVLLQYPEHSKVLPFTRNAGGCPGSGAFPKPEECQYFYFCVPSYGDPTKFLRTEHICDTHYVFDYLTATCKKADCIDVVLQDPGMNPAPSTSEVPSWFTETPTWFKETPWWFKTPPAWFHTPPAWLSNPPKKHIINEQIDVEAGPGFEIERPDQISKNVGMSNDSSHFYDDKTLRINIPIKIVQQ